MASSLKGQFLVANPSLPDPNFQRTVVLMCEHTEEGALGLVINRLSEFTLAEAIPNIPVNSDSSEALREGGPVQRESVFILHEAPAVGAESVCEGVYFGADRQTLERVVDQNAQTGLRFSLFAGYAGWGDGQLEYELSHQSWIVCPADPEVVFSANVVDAWSDVLKGMGGAYALMAQMPLDPTQN